MRVRPRKKPSRLGTEARGSYFHARREGHISMNHESWDSQTYLCISTIDHAVATSHQTWVLKRKEPWQGARKNIWQSSKEHLRLDNPNPMSRSPQAKGLDMSPAISAIFCSRSQAKGPEVVGNRKIYCFCLISNQAIMTSDDAGTQLSMPTLYPILHRLVLAHGPSTKFFFWSGQCQVSFIPLLLHTLKGILFMIRHPMTNRHHNHQRTPRTTNNTTDKPFIQSNRIKQMAMGPNHLERHQQLNLQTAKTSMVCEMLYIIVYLIMSDLSPLFPRLLSSLFIGLVPTLPQQSLLYQSHQPTDHPVLSRPINHIFPCRHLALTPSTPAIGVFFFFSKSLQSRFLTIQLFRNQQT
ncbi:hypothetical protein VP01_6608g1 [Puccinia sorghi]|uniref:Uncharacterized protein n=1 Tax=Puccinia sorghi TaxID=27349 RepID=A0A0L6UF41_9BASI|nr:hypothetical protein VP01_6608g1 [Puccinia sorghi]